MNLLKISRFFHLLSIAFFSFVFQPFVFATESTEIYKPDQGCTRTFIYKNRNYPVDSSRKIDGEGLRFVFKNRSQAEDMLNQYQQKGRANRWPAYLGTLGAASLLSGYIYSTYFLTDTPVGQNDTRILMYTSGLTLIVGSYLYGQLFNMGKERTLENAIETYNNAVPSHEKIQVELTPLPSGTGGEIKTVVPL